MTTTATTAATCFQEGPAAAPEVPWVWQQVWRDVLLLHWRASAADLRKHVPSGLSIDTYAGDTWVSIVLFRLQVAPLGWPRMPGFSSLVEVNLRTYVKLADQPGIWFLSIHADNLAALSLARLITPLPYAWANLRYRPGPCGCECQMKRASAPACELSLCTEFGRPLPANGDDPLQSWLLERYRAFAPARRMPGGLQTAIVAHEPWQVVPAEVKLQRNTLGRALGLDLDRPPDAAHFCREMAARFSRFEPCTVPHQGTEI